MSQKFIDGNNLKRAVDYIKDGTIVAGKASKTSNGSNIQVELKSFTNVSANNWVSDSTYSGYSYKCDLSCTGITSSSVVMVIFGATEADSGNYAPVCTTSTNKVTIYSKVNTSITIPTIKEI